VGLGQAEPASKAKLGKKRHKSERRILSIEETACVLARLEDPNKLIIEGCIATGARISEILGISETPGLKWKHVDLNAATIKIAQRVWHQDIGRPKKRRQPTPARYPLQKTSGTSVRTGS